VAGTMLCSKLVQLNTFRMRGDECCQRTWMDSCAFNEIDHANELPAAVRRQQSERHERHRHVTMPHPVPVPASLEIYLVCRYDNLAPRRSQSAHNLLLGRRPYRYPGMLSSPLVSLVVPSRALPQTLPSKKSLYHPPPPPTATRGSLQPPTINPVPKRAKHPLMLPRLHPLQGCCVCPPLQTNNS